MKKLFICALALASVVACSKDDTADAVLTSKMKSVTITIQNSKMNDTRANVTGAKINVAPEGGEAGDTAQATENELVASAGQLQILFANAQGLILEAKSLVADATNETHPAGTEDYTYGKVTVDANGNGTYIFHHVPEQVTRVAVVRVQKDDITIKPNSTNLSEVLALASDESENRTRGTQEIILYAEDDLIKMTATEGTTDDICYTDPNTGLKYYYYTAQLTVQPQVARVELVKVGCYDLGDLNIDVIEGTENPNIETQGLDELTIKKFYFSNYTKTWQTENVLVGSYCATKHNGTEKLYITPAEGAWSWNIAEQDVPQMKLELDAVAHDWTVNNPGKTVTVVGLKDNEELTEANVDTFKKGNVYRLELDFSEANIDATDDALCVIATVDIKTWTVVPVYPVFGNN